MNRVRRNMQDHQNENKRGHQEINQEIIRDIKKPEEIPKNAETRPRESDHTPGQAG